MCYEKNAGEILEGLRRVVLIQSQLRFIKLRRFNCVRLRTLPKEENTVWPVGENPLGNKKTLCVKKAARKHENFRAAFTCLCGQHCFIRLLPANRLYPPVR